MSPEDTAEQRWKRIEDKHLGLAQSVELLTHDIHEMQKKHDRLDARERKAREALLSGIAAYLRALQEDGGSNGAT
jgi:hypothetical protein